MGELEIEGDLDMVGDTEGEVEERGEPECLPEMEEEGETEGLGVPGLFEGEFKGDAVREVVEEPPPVAVPPRKKGPERVGERDEETVGVEERDTL